jgi:ATP-dependent exoDNAse (exonuclease V) beta subunit
MAGMEEGLLPHNRSMFNEEELEEERRLCYVGITRAKKQLIFTYARNRYQFGRVQQNLPSRFLGEINTSLLSIHHHFDEHIQAERYYSYKKHKQNTKHTTSNKRRLIIDEEQLDALLNDELEIKDFLKD